MAERRGATCGRHSVRVVVCPSRPPAAAEEEGAAAGGVSASSLARVAARKREAVKHRVRIGSTEESIADHEKGEIIDGPVAMVRRSRQNKIGFCSRHACWVPRIDFKRQSRSPHSGKETAAFRLLLQKGSARTGKTMGTSWSSYWLVCLAFCLFPCLPLVNVYVAVR